MKNACQQNIGITYYGNDDSHNQRMHHTGKPRPPDAVHQIEDGGPAVYDNVPIAVEPQLDKDGLDEVLAESNVQEEIISAEPHKGSAD